MTYEMGDNTGKMWKARSDQSLYYQGKIKLNGEEHNALIIENMDQDGSRYYRTFIDIGGLKPLTDEQKEGYKSNPPSVKGGFTLNNDEFWLTGWSGATSDGKPQLSLKFQPKEEKNEKASSDF